MSVGQTEGLVKQMVVRLDTVSLSEWMSHLWGRAWNFECSKEAKRLGRRWCGAIRRLTGSYGV